MTALGYWGVLVIVLGGVGILVWSLIRISSVYSREEEKRDDYYRNGSYCGPVAVRGGEKFDVGEERSEDK